MPLLSARIKDRYARQAQTCADFGPRSSPRPKQMLYERLGVAGETSEYLQEEEPIGAYSSEDRLSCFFPIEALPRSCGFLLQRWLGVCQERMPSHAERIEYNICFARWRLQCEAGLWCVKALSVLGLENLQFFVIG